MADEDAPQTIEMSPNSAQETIAETKDSNTEQETEGKCANNTDETVTQETLELAKIDEEPPKTEELETILVTTDSIAEHENDFSNDSLLENIAEENDAEEAIEFKTDNVIVDCPELEKAGVFFQEVADDDKLESGETSPEQSPVQETTESVIEETNDEDDKAEDLTKMQIVDEAKEACSVQPSSPGHATSNGLEPSSELPPPQKPPDTQNGDSNQSTDSAKRKCDDAETSMSEMPNTKRLRNDIQENFLTRDKILNEFIESSDCTTSDQYQVQTEQILAEIRTLNELAKEKEREWNNIIHLKKMKEELLLRMQRRKQVLMLENGDSEEIRANSNGHSILKTNNVTSKTLKVPNPDGKKRTILPKPPNNQLELNGNLDLRQKQRNVVDVQSIIADYRQRHPETVPRRGRRIRNPAAQNNDKVLNFASLALCAGAQVHQTDVNGDLGFLLNAMEANRSEALSIAESTTQEPSFKDMLVQFAKLSQSERQELIQNAIKPPPPPYPEVTVHPVAAMTTTPTPTNSLLHGILTKSPKNAKSTFSPTLARLLTAPERANNNNNNGASPLQQNVVNASNMSISEILSTSKARNEITITPVGQYETQVKEEDEAEDNSADRLVIDETNEERRNGDNSSDGGEEVPQCQGCNQKSALFVCAGCGNQWYCSRDCQVAAWDEHSEVCSG